MPAGRRCLVLIQPEPDRDQQATTEGITVELVPDGLWVQRDSSPDEWNCVFVPASDLDRILKGDPFRS
jgi:hypothetical protein